MASTIENQGSIVTKVGANNQIELIYSEKTLRLHSKGGFSRRFNTEFEDIYFKSPHNKPPTEQSGWIPVAADVRGDEGIFIWNSYFTDGGPLDNTYQVLGFSLQTGEITKYYLDTGNILEAEQMRAWEAELSDPSSAYDSTQLYFGGGANGDGLEANLFNWFDDIINPGKSADTAKAVRSPVSAPSSYGKNSADIITNYNPKTDQPIQIDLSSFDGAVGKLKIAKKSKKVPKLAKKEIDFIYDSQAGYLYYNENGRQPDFGKGGIIAILEGAPRIGVGNLDFI